jgi:hypothetical protein
VRVRILFAGKRRRAFWAVEADGASNCENPASPLSLSDLSQGRYFRMRVDGDAPTFAAVQLPE